MRIPTLLLALTALLGADEFLLKDGRRLVGTVVGEEGTQLVIEVGIAKVRVERDEILEWIASLTPEEEYARRAGEIAEGDHEARLSLADWCRRERLSSGEEEQLRFILAEAPDHEEARRRLGYVRDDQGVWVLAEELWREEAATRHARFQAVCDGHRVHVDFVDRSLQQVCAALGEAAGIPVEVGEKAREKLADKRYSYRIAGHSLPQVITDLAAATGLEVVYDFSAERVFLGLASEATKLRRDLGLPTGKEWSYESLQRALDEQRIDARFRGISLQRALDELEETFDLPIVLDGNLFDEAIAAQISYTARNRPLRAVFRALLFERGWTVVVVGKTLFITTEEQAVRLRE